MKNKKLIPVLGVLFSFLLVTGIALVNEVPEGMLLGLTQDQIHKKFGSPQLKYIFDSALKKNRYYTLGEWNSMDDKDRPTVGWDFYELGRLDNILEYHIQYKMDAQRKEPRVLRYKIEFTEPIELREITKHIPEFIPVTNSDTTTYYWREKGKLTFKLVEISELAAFVSRGFERSTHEKQCSFMYELYLTSSPEEVSLNNKVSKLRVDVSSAEGENLFYKIGILGDKISSPFLTKATSKETKTKIEYVYCFTEKLGGEYEPELKCKNTYDNQGNKIEEIFYHEDDSGQKGTSIGTYTYDKRGNIIVEEYRGDGFLISKNTYTHKYDARGNKVERIGYDKEGNKDSITHYKYDENGNVIEEICNYIRGDIVGELFDNKWTYRYDENRNKIEVIYYKPVGELESKWTYEYDERGRKIRENRYGSSNKVKTSVISTYENGNKIRETNYDQEGKKIAVTHYKYDKEGNEIEKILYAHKSISGEIKTIPFEKKVYEYYTEQDLSKEYTFRKTTWGMSREEVKSRETGKVLYDTEKMLIYEGSIAGLDCDIVYIFAGGKLVRAKYHITEEHSNENRYISDYKSLKKSLTKKYGQPIMDEHHWKRDLYKDDPQRWGFAISIGDLSYYAAWDTLQTIILLALFGDNYDVTLGTEYKSKELKELEEREKEKKLLEEF